METFDPEDVGSPQSMSFLFHLSMWWKILYGCIRIAIAVILFNLIGTSFIDLFSKIMSHEIATDPSDFLYQFVYRILENHSFTITYFVVIYLLFWGMIDIVFSVLLLRHKLWAFPFSLVMMSLFTIYEVYRVIHTKSLILLSLILLSIGIMYLIYNEYRNLKKKHIVI